MRHTASLFFFLTLFWLFNSGHYTFLLLILGAASISLAIFIAHRMDVIDNESQPLHLTKRLPAYLFWLFKEITLANISVLKHIWSKNPDISPTLATIRTSQTTDMGKVIYANTITLTPGTITVDISDDQITVHALTEESISALEDGHYDQRVRSVEE